MTDILAWISLIVGIVSIVLAVVSMISSSNFEKMSQENFEKTQTMMNDIYDKTKDLLHQIDNKSTLINSSVERNTTQLTILFSNVLDKVIQDQNVKELPDITNEETLKKVMEKEKLSNNDISNQIALQLLPELIKNPDSLEKLFEISEKMKKK